MNSFKRLLPVCAVVCALAVAVGVQAQGTHDWNDPAGGVYGTFTNWTPIGIPASNDAARFPINGTYTVSFIQSRTAGELEVVNGSQLTFDGTGIQGVGDRLYTVNLASIDLGTRLTLERLVNQERDINLDVLNRLDVTGTLQILETSEVTSAEANVDSGTNFNTALVTVANTIDGDRSTWDVPELNVGLTNRGRVSILDGARATSEFAVIGDAAGSFGDVQVRGASGAGINSEWTVSDIITDTIIGNAGRGLLTIQDGGMVETMDVILGNMPTGDADVLVTGLDPNGNHATWVARTISIGPSGTGDLTIQDGGVVVAQSVLVQNGVLDLRGGELNATFITHTNSFDMTGGRLTVDSVNGELIVLGGTVAPGRSFGPTQVNGVYQQHADGTLEIELGGTVAGVNHDVLTVIGSATLGGTLEIGFGPVCGIFEPDPSDTFTIVDAGILNGAFANAPNGSRLRTVDGVGSFLVSYAAGEVSLTDYQASIPGDADGDGDVDLQDFNILAANFTLSNTNGGYTVGDFDLNHVVDLADFNILAAFFGVQPEQLASLPEPASIALLALAGAILRDRNTCFR